MIDGKNGSVRAHLAQRIWVNPLDLHEAQNKKVFVKMLVQCNFFSAYF